MTRDSFCTRVYLAPQGLWVTLDAGQLARVEFDVAKRTVRLGLEPTTPSAPLARVRIEQPAAIPGVGSFSPRTAFPVERGAYVVPLGAETTWVELGVRPRI
jgi:hypothetical protein